MFGFLADYLFTKEEQPTMENFNARFEMLNALKNHWWKRRTSGKYVAVFGDAKRLNIWQGTTSSTTDFNHYSESLNISQDDGSFTLSSDTTLPLSVSTYQNANTLRGKYFYCTVSNFPNTTEYVTQNKIYFVPATANAQVTDSGNIRYISIECQDVTTELVFGDWEYIQSSNRSAYPDSGEQDGYEYQYLGIPFENAVGAPKIETGSYTGTGTYGSSNPPNTLEFHFKPLMVVVVADGPGMLKLGTVFIQGQARNQGIGTAYSSGSGLDLTVSWSGNSVSWYDGDEDRQLNTSGVTYWYCAIGRKE